MKTLLHVIALSALSVTVPAALAGKADGKLDIYWIDSEGGGSTLIVTPNDESILIDTGNPGGRDAGRIVKVAKEVAKLRQIDHLLITHFHIDHFGGAAEVAQAMPIKHIYDKGVPATLVEDASFPLKIKPYKAIKSENRVTILPGWEVHLAQPAGQPTGFLNLSCLAANQKFTKTRAGKNELCVDSSPKEKDTSDNANSLALLLQFGDFRFFDGGDLSWNTEAELVCPTNRVGKVDIYQSNHHGLDASNNPLLVNSLSPVVTVVNNGPRKGGEKQSMNTFKAVPGLQALYQVHKSLHPGVSNTEDEHIANIEEKCEGHYIKCAVEPDGKSYTITLSGSSHSKTYQSRPAPAKKKTRAGL